MGGICGAGRGDSFGGGNEDPFESAGTFGNLTAPDEPKEEDENSYCNNNSNYKK